MSLSWIVLINRTEMKIFERSGVDIRFLKAFQNPDGRSPSRELSRHHPGQTSDGSLDRMYHGPSTAETPHDLVAKAFVVRMANWLDLQRIQGAFKNIEIAAEPRTLGIIRESLSPQLVRLVKQWVHKDLLKATNDAISEHIPLEHIP